MHREEAKTGRCSPCDAVLFRAGNRGFTAADIVDAAGFRGDLGPLWEDFLARIACERRADEQGLEADSEAIQELSEDIRYKNDMLTAEETEAWLCARNLTLEDLESASRRRYWKERMDARAGEQALDYSDAPGELREAFLQDLMFCGELAGLARLLSVRAACSAGALPPEQALVSRRKAGRSQFLERIHSLSGQLSNRIRKLGREETWLEAMLELEAVYAWNCDVLKTPENRARMLAALRLPLTRFEVETLDLESEDAVREACLCLSVDGLSMEELAGQEHCRTERRDLLLEDFPEQLQQRFLSAECGQVIGLNTPGERFQICRILSKQEPSLDDVAVLARVDAGVLSGHFENLVSEHITWLIGPDSPA